jgi:hypothetical protein
MLKNRFQMLKRKSQRENGAAWKNGFAAKSSLWPLEDEEDTGFELSAGDDTECSREFDAF